MVLLKESNKILPNPVKFCVEKTLTQDVKSEQVFKVLSIDQN